MRYTMITTAILLLFAAMPCPAASVADAIDYEWLAANAQVVTSPADGRQYHKVDDMLFPVKERNFGSAYSTVNKLWPNGKVYYQFQPDITDDQKAIFRTACQSWQYGGNLQFSEGNGEGNYINVFNGGTNQSVEGMVGGPNFLMLSTWNAGVAAHEIGHALSLMHEHQRADRNSYITVFIENATQDGRGELSSAENLTEYYHILTDYDFLSLMHYPRWAFSANGKDTITCNSGYEQFQNAMGQGAMISALDRVGVAKLYGGDATTCSISMAVNDGSMGSVKVGDSSALRPFDASLLTLANPGVPLTLTAVPQGNYGVSDYAFDHWEVSNATVSDAYAATASFTPLGDCTVKAWFKPKTYTVTFTAEEGGTLSGATAQTVNSGNSTSAVTATSNNGFAFDAWTMRWNGYATYSYDATLVISSVRMDMTATASFKEIVLHHTVTFSAGEGGALQGETTQVVVEGVSAGAVEAVPNEGYAFVKWSGDYKGGENPLTLKEVKQDMVVNAEFIKVLTEVTIGTRFMLSAEIVYGHQEGVTWTFRHNSKVTVNNKNAKVINGKDNYIIELECEWTARLPVDGKALAVYVDHNGTPYRIMMKAPEITTVEKDGDTLKVKGKFFGKSPQIKIGKKRVKAAVTFDQKTNASEAVIQNPKGLKGKLFVANKIGVVEAEVE